MAAPTYKWEFAYDLMGDRIPKIATLEASSGLDVVDGTLCIMASGQVDEATASAVNIIGIAKETVSGATAGDPVKVALLAPGMVIKGTADADATALAGFSGKAVDVNSDGSLDVADTTNGSLSVHRVENSGLTVYCVVAKGALFG